MRLPFTIPFPLERRTYTYAAVALVVLLLGWFLFVRDTGDTEQVFVAHRGEFMQQVSVSGTVKAAENVNLGFAQNGRVSRISASVGDFVWQGTVLAQVENGELRAAVSQKLAALAAEEAKLAALQAGTRSEELAVSEAQVSLDEDALAQANIAVVNAIRTAFTQSDDAVRNKVDQFIYNPSSGSPALTFQTSDSQVKINTENARVEVEAMLTEWQKSVTMLSSSGDLAGAEATAKSNIAKVTNLLFLANNSLNSYVPASSPSQATIDGYITNVGTARANVNTAETSLTTAITARKSAAATLAKDRRKLELDRAGSTKEDVDQQAARVAGARADVANAQAQLDRTYVVAPFDGTVTKMDAKVGEAVSTGESEISMIGRDSFEVESYVPEVNIALVSVGDTAIVTLDAYGENVPFEAKVVSIDPAETVRDGVATYRALLRFTKEDPRIRSGMTANVVIMTEQRSNVISIPQNMVFDKDDKRYVYVEANGVATEREVTTGAVSSFGEIEIVSGLSEGDTVLKRAP